MGGSEVAKLRQRLEEICTAMHRGLYDYAIVGKHEVITHKYEMLGETQEQLALYIGKEQAFQDVLDALQRSEKSGSGQQANNPPKQDCSSLHLESVYVGRSNLS